MDCGYSLEPTWRGGSNEYPRSIFSSKNTKNNVFPFKPRFYYIKMGLKGLKIIYACLRDAVREHSILKDHVGRAIRTYVFGHIRTAKAQTTLQSNQGFHSPLCRPRWLSWMRARLVIRRLRVRPPPVRQHSFVEIWSWNIFYGHSLPSAD